MVTQASQPEVTVNTETGGWNFRLGFTLFSLVCVLELLSASYLMIAMATPPIIEHFHTHQLTWLSTSFLLVGAVSAPLLGKVADMYGKKKMLMLCLVLAIIGSLLSATATTFGMVIAGRCLAGFLVPTLFLSYSLIRDTFPEKTIALAVSIATSGLGLIAIVVPFIAGWLLDDYGWRSIFWFFFIALVVLTPLVFITARESSIRVRSRIDFLGAALLGAGIAGILIGVSFGQEWGWSSGRTLGFLLGGIALVCAWIVTARVSKDPLIDLKVLSKRSVFFIALSAGAIYGISGLYSTLLPLLAMQPKAYHDIFGLKYAVFGVSFKGFSQFQAPIAVFTVLGGLVVGFLVGRKLLKPRILTAAGMAFAGVGGLLTAYQHDNKWALIVFASLVGFGMGFGYAASPNLLIEAVPPKLQASTASIVAVFSSMLPAILPVIAFTIMNNSYLVSKDEVKAQSSQLYDALVKNDPATWKAISSNPQTWQMIKSNPATWEGIKNDPRTWEGIKNDPRTWDAMKNNPQVVAQVRQGMEAKGVPPQIIDEQLPAALEQAKPMILEQAKPMILEQSKETILEASKPMILEASKEQILAASGPAVMAGTPEQPGAINTFEANAPYKDKGFEVGFLIVAITAVVGLGAALIIPKKIEQINMDEVKV
jgi:MFS family permease